MAFVDEARITVIAGRGGNGCISFRREKYVPRGGPSGGNGGSGGSVIFRATRDKTTLYDFKFRPKYEGKKGEHGMGRDCDGRQGEPLLLEVPVGTRILDEASGELLTDLTLHGQSVVIAKGGKGGRGNKTFTTSTNRAPRIATPGEAGETRTVQLELRILADVGLVGLPNAGKSSLLRALSKARPKVASYPFTTLEPHLGVVTTPRNTFVVADIPGLIEGAAEGAGLGHRFLRHALRSRVLLHLVDCGASRKEIEKSVETINLELEAFDADLIKKTSLFVFTKSDCLSKAQLANRRRQLSRYNGIFISSHSHFGIETLISAVSSLLDPQ